MICSLPGFHVTVNAYLCRASTIAYILLGAASSDLLMIDSSGRWSVGIVTFGWPKIYWSNLFMANTIARHSNSTNFFAESYRLCVPELKSVRWQCAILGQLVGTTKIQDGCRDPRKLQNVFIFTLHHARNIIFVYTRKL